MKAQTSELVPAVRTGAGVTIGLCFIVAVLEGLDIQAMGVAAPRLAAELQLPGGVLGQRNKSPEWRIPLRCPRKSVVLIGNSKTDHG